MIFSANALSVGVNISNRSLLSRVKLHSTLCQWVWWWTLQKHIPKSN